MSVNFDFESLIRLIEKKFPKCTFLQQVKDILTTKQAELFQTAKKMLAQLLSNVTNKQLEVEGSDTIEQSMSESEPEFDFLGLNAKKTADNSIFAEIEKFSKTAFSDAVESFKDGIRRYPEVPAFIELSQATSDYWARAGNFPKLKSLYKLLEATTSCSSTERHFSQISKKPNSLKKGADFETVSKIVRR